MKENTELEIKKEDSAEIQMIKLRHQQWLSDPITQALLKGFKAHRETFIKFISDAAANRNVTSEEIRGMANAIKTMDNVITTTTNPDALIFKLSKLS